MSDQLSLLNEESGELTKLTPEHQFWQQQVTRLSNWEVVANDTAAWYKEVELPAISKDASEAEIQRALSKIPDLEKEVKVLTKLAKDMKDRRLEITRTFEDTKKRLMHPEKIYEGYLENLKSGLLKLKVKEEEILEKKRKRIKELEDFRVRVQEVLNTYIYTLTSDISRDIETIYKSALSEGFKTRIWKAIEEALIEDFECKIPPLKEASGDKEKQDIYNSIISTFNPKYHYDTFVNGLKAELERFDEDLSNIEQAKLRIKQEKLEAEKKAKEDLDFNNEMAQYAGAGKAVAIPQLVSKKLQSSFKIDMSGTDSDIYLILQVFLKDVPNFMRHYKGRTRIDVVDKIIALIEAEKNFLPSSEVFEGLDFVEVKSL